MHSLRNVFKKKDADTEDRDISTPPPEEEITKGHIPNADEEALSEEPLPPPPPDFEPGDITAKPEAGAPDKKRADKRIGSRFFIILFQALASMMTLKKWVIFLIAASSVPVIAAVILNGVIASDPLFQSLEVQRMLIRDIFLLITYVWTAGLVLAFSAAGNASGFIAREAKDHTLLILVSKPVRRIEILFGKFSAYVINMIALEALAMIITSYLIIYLSGVDLSIWGELLATIPYLLLFVVIMILIFGAIPMALSATSNSPGRIMLGMAGLATFMYFGFLFIRQLLGSTYEEYWLYTIDLGYHLGNIYTYLLTAFDLNPGYFFQIAMAIFSGVYDFSTMPIDNDQNIMVQMDTTNYFTQPQSIIVWMIIPIALIILAIIRLQKRNIN